MSGREETLGETRNSLKGLYFCSGQKKSWTVLLKRDMSCFPTVSLLPPLGKVGESITFMVNLYYVVSCTTNSINWVHLTSADLNFYCREKSQLYDRVKVGSQTLQPLCQIHFTVAGLDQFLLS